MMPKQLASKSIMGEEKIETTYLETLPGTVIAMGSGLLLVVFMSAGSYNVLGSEASLFLTFMFIIIGMLMFAMNVPVSGSFLERRHRCLKCGAREHTSVRNKKAKEEVVKMGPMLGDITKCRSDEFVLECSCCGNKHKYISIRSEPKG